MSDSNKVKDYFNRASDLFNSIYTGEKSGFLRFLDRILRPDMEKRFLYTMNEIQKRKPASLLDIGIGPGQYLRAYMQLEVPRICALDFSDEMISLAKKEVADIDYKGDLSYIINDFMDAEFENEFDLTVAMGVLDYIADPLSFLSRMKTVTKDCCLISFPSNSIWRTPIRKIRYKIKKCPVYFYSRNKIARLASQAGFSSCEIIKIRGSGMDYWVRLTA